MRLLHNIGTEKHSNYNTREEILACDDDLSFDGVYKNVWDNRDVLEQKLKEGKKIILFIMGDYVGGDNSFDLDNVPKKEEYCTWKELSDLQKMGCEIGWHTWSHPDLTTLDEPEIEMELDCPFVTEYLAYPHGRFNDKVKKAARRMGYTKAWSVNQGDSTNLSLRREYL